VFGHAIRQRYEYRHGQTTGYSTVYSFQGLPNDGRTPEAGVVRNGNGILFGMTRFGPAGGTLFSLTPPGTAGGIWTERVLINGFADPQYGGVVIGPHGELYGTTYNGGPIGACAPIGYGTVFEAIPPAQPGGAWTVSTLYNFAGGSDGVYPISGVVLLYAFKGGSNDGSSPYRGVVLGANGAIYGTTSSGGSGNFGIVFELRPPATAGGTWTETLVHSFMGDPSDALILRELWRSTQMECCTAPVAGAATRARGWHLWPRRHRGWWNLGVEHHPRIHRERWSRSATQTDIGPKWSAVRLDLRASACGQQHFRFKATTAGDAWTFSVLHRFAHGAGQIQGTLLVGAAGEIFGTTAVGGVRTVGAAPYFRSYPSGLLLGSIRLRRHRLSLVDPLHHCQMIL
jgi:hypothetical protein